MDLELIEKLFSLLDRSTAEELEVTENGVTIRISKSRQASGHAAPVVAAASTPSALPYNAISATAKQAATHAEVRAGMTGTFYRSASPDAPAFVEVGSRISDGDRLALLEAMKTFNPVEAECDGVITDIIAQDGALVEAGDVLFRIERAG